MFNSYSMLVYQRVMLVEAIDAHDNDNSDNGGKGL